MCITYRRQILGDLDFDLSRSSRTNVMVQLAGPLYIIS